VTFAMETNFLSPHARSDFNSALYWICHVTGWCKLAYYSTLEMDLLETAVEILVEGALD
jgi:hypothetical protein